MKNTCLVLCIGFLFAGTLNQARAQARTAILTGDTCAGSTLKASISSGVFSTIKWYKDTTLLTVRSTWQRYGVVVAGTTPGQGTSQLSEPKGIFVDKNKNIYIVDDGKQAVIKWAPGATTGVIVAGGNGKGSALNQFYTPGDVLVDNNKNVYVSDDLTASVRKWAPGATAGVIVAGGHGEGSAANQLFGPQSICMDRFGNLYIADRWNDRVQKWAPGAASGTTVAGGNGRGSAANQLDEPLGVGVDYAGNVYVSDPYNNRVQKWTPGATTGVTVAGGHGNGFAANQLASPWEITVDSAGTVFAIDGGSRVQKWIPGAAYGITVAGGYGYPQSPDTSLDKVGTSYGLFVDGNENIYVSDLFQGRVRRFAKAQISSDEFPNATTGTYRVEILNDANKVFPSAALHVADIPDGAPTQLYGNRNVIGNQKYKYYISEYIKNAVYTWEVTGDAVIQSGQGTPNIIVKWGVQPSTLSVTASSGCGISKTRSVPISVTPPGVANAGKTNSLPAITLYPNPSANVASISFTALKPAQYEVTLTSIMGKTLLKQKGLVSTGKNKIDLDIARLPKDNYVIDVKYDDKAGQLKLQKQ